MKRPLRWVAVAACSATATLLLVPATAAVAAADQQSVRYLGHTFTVPSSWSIVDLANDPHACVRFDQHALYLGAPSADQDCPSHVIGRTEAVLVAPATGSAAVGVTENPTAQEITASASGVTVTATYGKDSTLVRGIVSGAGFAAGQSRNGGAQSQSVTPRAAGTAAVAAGVSANATTYAGKAFDACAAPSPSTMNAWLASPYRGVGIYIGGVDRGCSQPNLTASWVSQQASAGWHFLPLYVGPQASVNQITSPTSQGTAAADDAANQAAALGFGPGTPVYYDMESYQPAQRAAALSFESAWTSELHVRGYLSGYYSSSNSGILDLVNNYSSYLMPDILDVANWNNVASTDDANVPSYRWAQHQRVHQYTGGVTETYSGVSINIDHDYMDVVSGSSLLGGGGSNTASQTAIQSDGTVDMFYRGNDGGLWTVHNDGSGFASAPIELPGTIGTVVGEPSAVTSTPGVVDVFYKGTDNNLWHKWFAGGTWQGPQNLGDGPLGGPPRAVAQPNGTVDVFWRGTSGAMWHAWFVSGIGWQGPQNAGGTLASDPSPTITSPAVIDVFYQNSTNVLFHTWYVPGVGWQGPSSLNLGPLAGVPSAVGQPNGNVDVFWRNADNTIGRGSFVSGVGWQAQQNLGGTLSADPTATNSAPGVVYVFYQGPDNSLWSTRSANWSAPVSLNLGPLAGRPTAGGIHNGTVEVFWPGPEAGVNHAQYRTDTGWSVAQSLGGAGTYAP